MKIYNLFWYTRILYEVIIFINSMIISKEFKLYIQCSDLYTFFVIFFLKKFEYFESSGWIEHILKNKSHLQLDQIRFLRFSIKKNFNSFCTKTFPIDSP